MVLFISLYKSFHIYSIVSKKRYETVEGICVGITSKLIGKCNKIKIMDKDSCTHVVAAPAGTFLFIDLFWP